MPTPDSNQPSPTSNPLSKPGLASFVDSAVLLIDRDGLDDFSMRALAREVGRDPMALYRHAPSKAALLDAVADTVLSTVVAIDATDPDWRGQLRRFAHDYRRVALAHPHIVILMVTRPQATPLGLRAHGTLVPLEAVLAVLTAAGLDQPAALRAYRALMAFLRGHVLTELQESSSRPHEVPDLLRLELGRLHPELFPVTRTMAPHLASFDGALELDFGVDLLLSALHNIVTQGPDLPRNR